MIERTISQSMYDAIPKEHAEELDKVKEAIYHEHLDALTCRMARKKAQGTWTEQDQNEYDKAYKKCSELIAVEEAKPIFNPGEKVVIVTDEEYQKLLEEEAARRAAEEEARRKAEEEKIKAEQEALRKAEEAAQEQTVTDVDESVQGELPSVRDYKNGEQVF